MYVKKSHKSLRLNYLCRYVGKKPFFDDTPAWRGVWWCAGLPYPLYIISLLLLLIEIIHYSWGSESGYEQLTGPEGGFFYLQ